MEWTGGPGERPFEAPELRVAEWIGADGEPLPEPLKLADLGSGLKVIFCFQHWCRGCHTDGFPTLIELMKSYPQAGFAVIQTVFEGAHLNTRERLRETQLRYGLVVPFGHDLVPGSWPTFMVDYRTQGTPWFSVIDSANQVRFNNFYVIPSLVERLSP